MRTPTDAAEAAPNVGANPNTALRGVAKLTATRLVVEVGFSRFEHPQKLIGYAGITPSDHDVPLAFHVLRSTPASE